MMKVFKFFGGESFKSLFVPQDIHGIGVIVKDDI
jgi:hypothetical protein